MTGRQLTFQHKFFITGFHLKNWIRKDHLLRKIRKHIDFEFIYTSPVICDSETHGVAFPLRCEQISFLRTVLKAQEAVAGALRVSFHLVLGNSTAPWNATTVLRYKSIPKSGDDFFLEGVFHRQKCRSKPQ